MSARGNMRSGRYVLDFDWAAAQRQQSLAIWPQLAAAYVALNKAAEDGRAKASALKNDPNYTPVGRANQMKNWLLGDGLAPVKAARGAMKAAQAEIDATRAKMTGAAIDKSDVAGAVLRTDLRAWFRGLDPAARTARLVMKDIPQDLKLAILEAPPELSGVSAEQKAAVERDEIEARHPDEVAKLDLISQAMLALESAERAALMTFTDEVGVSRHDIATELGEPDLLTREGRIDHFVDAGLPDERKPEEQAPVAA